MSLFIMMTRLAPAAMKSPRSLQESERSAMDRIKKECPQVEWLQNYAVMGPYDYLDIFQAPDLETAFKVSAIIRTLGHGQTEVWPATEWSFFKGWIGDLTETES